MPLTDEFARVAISEITVERDTRQRRQIDTTGLEASIAKHGLLQPIIIDRQGKLHAGERRLTACKNLGHADIPVRFVEDLSPLEAQIIELEENLKRSELEWQDQAAAVARIHRLYRQAEPDWTMAETANALSMTQGHVSMLISVHQEASAPATPVLAERLVKAGSAREAWNIVKRREQRAAGEALAELLSDGGPTSAPEARGAEDAPALPEEAILNESFLAWAPNYVGPKFNLIHCDFPYGVNFNSGPQAKGAEPTGGYDDSPEVYRQLLECLCANVPRVMSVNSHIMFWLSAEPTVISWTLEFFAQRAPQIEWSKFPLIWMKSDNAGIAGDPRRSLRHTYETCLLGSIGRRQLVQIVSDAYAAPTDHSLHMSTKPEPMLRHFMRALVDESSTLFDPTCGSGAALRAAESLGAKRTLGLEIDPECCASARVALSNARKLRHGASALGL